MADQTGRGWDECVHVPYMPADQNVKNSHCWKCGQVMVREKAPWIWRAVPDHGVTKHGGVG